MNRAIIIQADDWEGLFINGVLIEEGHTLNQGMSRIKYLKNASEEYYFKLDCLIETYIDELDEDDLYNRGSFPSTISEMKGIYDSNDGEPIN